MEGTIYHEECLMRLARKGKFKVKPPGKPAYSLVPTPQEFEMIRAGVNVLIVCKTTTKIFEQEKVPTLPLVIDRLFTMDKELEEIIEDPENQDEMVVNFAIAVREQLKKDNSFPDYGTKNELTCMANYLNPTLKGCHLKMKNINKFEGTKTKIEQQQNHWKCDSDLEEVDEDIVDVPEETSVKKLTPTELLKRQLREEDDKTKSRVNEGSGVFGDPETAIKKEMKTYETLMEAKDGTDLLKWWKSHSEQLPLLSYMVRIIFCIPAASSKSERVFSVAGRIVTLSRARTAPEQVENLVIMKCNLRLRER